VIISSCEELSEGDELVGTVEDPQDPYEDYPDLWDAEKTPEILLDIARKLKDLGNEAFKAKNFNRAVDKYQKVRYSML
jgi:peptidyl-prolyl isomerase D